MARAPGFPDGVSLRSSRAEMLGWVQSSLMAIDRSLHRESLVESASLMDDLGFDSLRLEELVASIKLLHPHLDLTPWYVQAAHRGEDTVGSLVDFLSAHVGAS